ncbi:MAG: holo-ACP synthase, partial [Chlamydiae bacterium]|nr:holo-ACP synthase [Chlamydiota bacterium]
MRGIGTDIIEIERIKKAHSKHGERFIERILTENERAYCAKYSEPWQQIAGRFAAKEAVLKAFGTGLVGEMTWHEIEVINNEAGKPEVFLSKRL